MSQEYGIVQPWEDDRIAPNGRSVAENFKAWFGQSKVVDHDGKPLVAHHGSGHDFAQFKTEGGTGKSHGTGAFFTSSTAVANSYTTGMSPNVMPVFLCLKTPVVIDALGKNWARIEQKSKVYLPQTFVASERAQETEDLFAALMDTPVQKAAPIMRKARSTNVRQLFKGEWNYPDDTASTDDLARWARFNGYDGLIVRNVIDRGPCGIHDAQEALSPSTIYVAFDPSQIKSAIGNAGLYLPHSNCLTDERAHRELLQANRAIREVCNAAATRSLEMTP